MADAAAVHATIDAYFEAFNARDRERWVSLFTDDARQEDPVGQPVNIGHEAIGSFFDMITTFGPVTITPTRDAILIADEAMMFLTAVSETPDATITVPFIVDHLVFAPDGRITSLRAFWDNDSITTEAS